MKAQLAKLLNWFDDKNSVLVALSGGVDSALVAYSAYVKLGESAIAVTADYKTLAQEELEYAKKISSEIGIKHIVCLLYTSPSPRDGLLSRMPSSA